MYMSKITCICLVGGQSGDVAANDDEKAVFF